MPSQPPPPQPMPAPANPSRPARKMSASIAQRAPSNSSRMPSGGGGSPMSFGAAMSGISFTHGGGGAGAAGGGYSYGKWGNAAGSYGARFYGDAGESSPQMLFSTSINMDPGSFAASSHAFGLPSSSYTRGLGRSYAAAVSGREYNALSASLASLSTHPMAGSMGRSYSRSQLESIMALRSDAEHTKEYDCCGQTHQGLHALLEHVEDQHPYSDPNMPDAGFSPVTLAMDLDLEGDGDPQEHAAAPGSTRSSTSPRPMPNYPLTPTSATPKSESAIPTAVPSSSSLAPLSLSDVLKSPPDNESSLSTAQLTTGSTSSSPDTSLPTPTASAHPSPSFMPPKITSASRGAFLGPSAKLTSTRFDRAFNEVVAGKGAHEDASKPPGLTAVAPGVLFTAAAALGIPSAPPVVGRRDGTIGNGTLPPPPADDLEENKDIATPSDRPKPPEPQLPQPSLFTTHKAWRCPNPGCNKAYKQSNGLKYHLQKGQCDFAIHDAIDHGLTLEEAEERSRPYVCAVGAGCTKRYRQMNGLKYHYLNSGEHGEYGLRMLQNGTHPHPPSLPPPPKRDRIHPVTTPTAPATITASARPNAAPYAIPSQLSRPVPSAHHHTGPRMGTWPAQRPVNSATIGSTAAAAAPQAPARTTATPSNATPVAVQPTLTAPSQRGRDAVLFANIDPLDV